MGRPPRDGPSCLQWALNSWGLESHSAGGLWDMNHLTTHHTLWSHNHTRNPKARPDGLPDWINNVTFDWDIGFIMGDSATPANWKANVIGNYFICPPGNLRSVALEKANLDRNGSPNFTLHVGANLMDKNGNGLLDGSNYGYGIASGSYALSAAPIISGSPLPVTVDDPLTAYKKIVSFAGPLRLDAGSSTPLRDDVDTILINNLVARTPDHISNMTQSGGSNGGLGTLNSLVAPVDSDLDGMPDYWELSIGSSHVVASHNNPVPAGAYIPNVPAGYTLLEEYLHFLAIPHAAIPKNTVADPSSLTVDLRRFVRGFDVAPVVFTLSNAANGSATLQPDGYTAVFQPTVDFSGRARFDFTVADGDGSTWTQTLAVLVSSQALPNDLVWQGDGAVNAWDTTTANFVDETVPATFAVGDNVRFDEGGSRSPAVQVVGALTPGVVEVDTDLGYSFGGSGSLGGGMSLIKTGAGTLTLGNSGPNGYVGGTRISEGTVTLGAAGGLGAGGVILENTALLQLGSLSLASGNALTISGSPTITGGNGGGLTDIHAVSGTGTLNILPTNVFDLQGSLGGFNGTLLFSGNQSVRFYGSTGGASAAFDLGAGSLNLNKRSNAGTITLGALSGGPNTVLQGASGTGNTSATTYLIGGKGLDTTFEGTIINGQGTTGITKTGGGRLTLTGNHTYSGTTTIDNGVLAVNGSTAGGAVTVAAGGTLSGTGSVGGAVTAQTGSYLSPGGAPGEAFTLNVGSGLDLSGATLLFDLSSNPASGNDAIVMNGGTLIYRVPAAYFQFNLVDGALSPGTCTLISGGAGTSAPGSPSLVHNLPTGGRQTFSLQRSGGGSSDAFARLLVTGNPAALVWKGDAGPNWDLSTLNWLNGAATDPFHNFDAVRLDDSAAAGNVTVVGTLEPLSMVVSNATLPYTLSGGTLDGPMSLTKTGAAALTINNTFDHTGGTSIEDGTVTFASNTSLGLRPVTLRGGALAPVSGDFEIPLVVDGAGTFIASATTHTYLKAPITGTGTLTIVPAENLWTYEHDLSGFTGTLALSGPGSLRLNQGGYTWGSSACHFDLGTAGTLNNRATTFAGEVYLGAVSGGAGSILMPSEKSDGPGLVDTCEVGALDLDTTFAGAVIDGPGHVLRLVKVGTGTWTLIGNNTYSGGTTVSAGTLRVNAPASGTGTGAVQVEYGATLSGAGAVSGEATLDDGAILEPGDGVGALGFEDGLNLNEFTQLHFVLGSAGDRVDVSGDLFVSGQLFVAAAGGFGPGVYPLFTWNPADTLTVGTLSFVSMPEGYDYRIDTATPGEVRLVVSDPEPVGVASLTLSGGDLVLSGAGGVPLNPYYMLGTTNLMLPPASWVRLATNLFDASGAFSITNPVAPGVDRYYYSVESP